MTRMLFINDIYPGAGTLSALPATMFITMGLMCIGLLICSVANIWLIVVSLRVGIMWALCVLFVPFAIFVFLFRHWDEAKQPFLCSMLGTLLMVAPPAMNWDAFSKQKDFAALAARIHAIRSQAPERKPEPTPAPQQTLEQKRAAFIQHTVELKAQYDALMARQPRLPPTDKAAHAAFDRDLAAYRAMRKQVEAEKADLEGPSPASAK